MKLRELSLVVISSVALTGGAALAQTNQTNNGDNKPIDFKKFVPPALPIFPPNSTLNSGTVGGTSDPYTTAPLQDPTPSPVQSAPGLKFTIPTR